MWSPQHINCLPQLTQFTPYFAAMQLKWVPHLIHLTLVLLLSFFTLHIRPQRPSHSATGVHAQLPRENRLSADHEDCYRIIYIHSDNWIQCRASNETVKLPVWVITSSLVSRSLSLRLIFCMSSIFWRTASAVLKDKISLDRHFAWRCICQW